MRQSYFFHADQRLTQQGLEGICESDGSTPFGEQCIWDIIMTMKINVVCSSREIISLNSDSRIPKALSHGDSYQSEVFTQLGRRSRSLWPRLSSGSNPNFYSMMAGGVGYGSVACFVREGVAQRKGQKCWSLVENRLISEDLAMAFYYITMEISRQALPQAIEQLSEGLLIVTHIIIRRVILYSLVLMNWKTATCILSWI